MPEPPAHERRPTRGYVFALAAAVMWALNASLGRYLLDDGVSAWRISQIRATGAWLILVAALALWRRDLLRVRRSEIPRLAVLGVGGLALVHAAYFLAIDRLEIGVAITIQYTAPLLLLVWLRVAHGRRLATGLWGAVALSFAGCFFVARAYDAASLDGLGLAAAVAAAVIFAFYMVSSERAGLLHHPLTTMVWAFGFAALFWALVQPWWSFPVERLSGDGNELVALGVVVIGTLLPFVLIVAALRHLPAPRAGVVATLEPVLAALFAWAIHGEALSAVQIAGGIAVLAGVIWVQSRAPDLEAELAPPVGAGLPLRRKPV